LRSAGKYEGRLILWRFGNEIGRAYRECSQAARENRIQTDLVARHEVLRAFRPQGLYPVSRIQGRRDQGLLLELQGISFERFYDDSRREGYTTSEKRHHRLENNLSRYRTQSEYRPTPQGSREIS